MAAKYILPALAFAGTTLAQSSQCSGDITVSSAADATGLAGCRTYDGSITIDGSVSGNLALDGIQSITGDLICHNSSSITAISAAQLGTISGTFDLNGLTILSTLQFGRLDRVNMIKWIALPALQSLNFNQGISEANEVYISNTGLTTLSGIELTQVGNMDINNNLDLKTINVNALTNVTQFLSFSANGMDLVIDFPNLEGAANLTFRTVSSISMPSLSEVGGAMGFYENSFTDFAAPNLTMTGNTIAFVDNPNLDNLTFPSLTRIGGGLQLANNSKLEIITGFPEVGVIVGDINYYGTFSQVAFGSLTEVRGAANVYTSSSNATVCTLFDSAKKNSVIKGNENCHVNVSSPETDGSNGTSSGSGNMAASGSQASMLVTGAVAFIAALFFI